MKSPQITRSAADDAGPVWTRAKKKGANPILGFVGFVLALFGALVLVLAALNGSFSKGGAQVDGWFGMVSDKTGLGKPRPVAMDQATPVEPASAPASSAPPKP